MVTENRVFSMKPDQGRRSIMIVGAYPPTVLDILPQSSWQRYKSAFEQNIEYLAKKLTPIIGTGVIADEGLLVNGQFRWEQGFRKWNTSVKAGRLFNSIPIDYTYIAQNTSKFYYPKDSILVGGDMMVVNPQEKDILPQELLLRGQNILLDKNLSIGGKFVVGDHIVFAGFNDLTSDQESILNENVFPRKTVVTIPHPRDLGLQFEKTVESHIDQFIGTPLPSNDGKTYYIPIEKAYYEQIKEKLPTTIGEVGRINLQYIPVISGDWYKLNYLNLPGGNIFIGPEMQKDLEAANVWNDINKQRVDVLPHELPLVDEYRAGMACKVVLL